MLLILHLLGNSMCYKHHNQIVDNVDTNINKTRQA